MENCRISIFMAFSITIFILTILLLIFESTLVSHYVKTFGPIFVTSDKNTV